jgi:hypothetical protein
MKWLAASLIVLACSAGCHAPKPSFNPFAAYGSSRVPPPATNSTARNAPYYNQPGGAPAGAAPAATPNPTNAPGSNAAPSLSNPSLTSSEDVWKSVVMRSANAGNDAGASAANGVELASFNSPSSSGGSSSGGSSAAVPGLFVPDAGSSPIASLPPPPTSVPANTVVATARASDSTPRAANSGTEGKPTLQWKTR